MKTETDVLIVGAGPSGMSAAITLAGFGVDVVVADEQPAPGGQIWRNVERRAEDPAYAMLGEDYRSGLDVVERFRAAQISYLPSTKVWQVEPGFKAYLAEDGHSRILKARLVLLATGAQERPAPFPGWTLPGVMTVGAAQILLKSSGQIPEEPVWIAGSGPLPLLYMAQLLQAGGRIAGFLDTSPRANTLRAVPRLPQALLGWPDLVKGISWLRRLRHSGVGIIRDVVAIEAHGTELLSHLQYQTADGAVVRIPASVLLVHEGVVPAIHMTMALNCLHEWHVEQDCFVPRLDPEGESSVENLFVAGDAAEIGGAKLALLRGERAGLAIARRLGRSAAGDQKRAAALAAALRAASRVRPFLDALYRPPARRIADAALVCRCEELTAGDIRASIVGSHIGPNQVKAFTRAGMGPCQGRQCAYTITRILAQERQVDMATVGFLRMRPPFKQIRLAEISSLADS